MISLRPGDNTLLYALLGPCPCHGPGPLQALLKDEIVLDTEGRAILFSRRTADPSFYVALTEALEFPVFNPTPAPRLPVSGKASRLLSKFST